MGSKSRHGELLSQLQMLLKLLQLARTRYDHLLCFITDQQSCIKQKACTLDIKNTLLVTILSASTVFDCNAVSYQSGRHKVGISRCLSAWHPVHCTYAQHGCFARK